MDNQSFTLLYMGETAKNRHAEMAASPQEKPKRPDFHLASWSKEIPPESSARPIGTTSKEFTQKNEVHEMENILEALDAVESAGSQTEQKTPETLNASDMQRETTNVIRVRNTEQPADAYRIWKNVVRILDQPDLPNRLTDNLPVIAGGLIEEARNHFGDDPQKIIAWLEAGKQRAAAEHIAGGSKTTTSFEKFNAVVEQAVAMVESNFQNKQIKGEAKAKNGLPGGEQIINRARLLEQYRDGLFLNSPQDYYATLTRLENDIKQQQISLTGERLNDASLQIAKGFLQDMIEQALRHYETLNTEARTISEEAKRYAGVRGWFRGLREWQQKADIHRRADAIEAKLIPWTNIHQRLTEKLQLAPPDGQDTITWMNEPQRQFQDDENIEQMSAAEIAARLSPTTSRLAGERQPRDKVSTPAAETNKKMPKVKIEKPVEYTESQNSPSETAEQEEKSAGVKVAARRIERKQRPANIYETIKVNYLHGASLNNPERYLERLRGLRDDVLAGEISIDNKKRIMNGDERRAAQELLQQYVDKALMKYRQIAAMREKKEKYKGMLLPSKEKTAAIRNARVGEQGWKNWQQVYNTLRQEFTTSQINAEPEWSDRNAEAWDEPGEEKSAAA